MADRQLPTPEELRQSLRYEPDTGKLFWKQRTDAPSWWNTRFSGTEAFTLDCGRGYKKGRFRYTVFYAHRVIWAVVTGAWPDGVIDHIDGNPSNNRWSNLRHTTASGNLKNVRRHRDNTSGFKGVSWHTQRSRWTADIYSDGKRYHLGLYDTPESAHAAYCAAAERLHGEFARTE